MIGNRLKELRDAEGLTQKKCADLVGTSKQYVSQLEAGRNKTPNGTFLEGWARHFNVHHRWLTTGAGPKWLLDDITTKGVSVNAEIDNLRRQIEALSAVVATMVAITSRYRPVEGEELARVIRGSEALAPARHDLAADILEMLKPAPAPSVKPVARARKRSVS